MERKKSISVPEMGRLLGLGKTESYYLVKKNWFKVVTIGGKMRVMADSFEEWYAGRITIKRKMLLILQRKGEDNTMASIVKRKKVFRSLYLYG